MILEQDGWTYFRFVESGEFKEWRIKNIQSNIPDEAKAEWRLIPKWSDHSTDPWTIYDLRMISDTDTRGNIILADDGTIRLRPNLKLMNIRQIIDRYNLKALEEDTRRSINSNRGVLGTHSFASDLKRHRATVTLQVLVPIEVREAIVNNGYQISTFCKKTIMDKLTDLGLLE